MRPDGSGKRNLTRHPADEWGPDWSPDGRRIAFESTRRSPTDADEHSGIYVMRADGSRQH